jgi:hypothetical protein
MMNEFGKWLMPDFFCFCLDEDANRLCPVDQMGFLLTRDKAQEIKALFEVYLKEYSDQFIQEQRALRYEKFFGCNREERKPIIRSPKKGHVYFVKDDTGYVKIGYSQQIDTRIRTLQAGNPTLRLLDTYLTSDIEGLESLLHETFADKRVNREWFALSAKDIKKAKSIITSFNQERGDS